MSHKLAISNWQIAMNYRLSIIDASVGMQLHRELIIDNVWRMAHGQSLITTAGGRC